MKTLAFIFAVLTAAATAHEVRPAFLELKERAPGEFDVLWKVPAPGGVAEIRYLNCMPGGCLYQPTYLGERGDIDPIEHSAGERRFADARHKGTAESDEHECGQEDADGRHDGSRHPAQHVTDECRGRE